MKMSNKDVQALIDEHKKTMELDSWAVELNYAVVQLAQCFVNHLNSQCEELGLRHPALPILYTLLHNGGKLTQKQLSIRLPASKQSVAATLKSLSDQGFVTKKTLRRDQRINQIQLTDKGISVLLLNMPVRDEFFERFMKFVGEEEGGKLTLSLRKIIAFYKRDLKKEKLRKTKMKKLQHLGKISR